MTFSHYTARRSRQNTHWQHLNNTLYGTRRSRQNTHWQHLNNTLYGTRRSRQNTHWQHLHMYETLCYIVLVKIHTEKV